MPYASALEGSHILVEDDVYTVAKGSRIAFVQKEIPCRQFADPAWIVPPPQLQWIPLHLPYMLLIPRYNPFQPPLFDGLNFSFDTFPLERVGRAWSLAEWLRIRWVTLERNLRAVLFAMLDFAYLSLPDLFHFWAFPERFGYKYAFSSPTITRTVAMRSRDAFLPIMATMSLMLLILNDREAKNPDFDWRGRILEKTQIHPAWLSALEASVIGDFSAPRVGGIIDMQGFQFARLLHLFEHIDMPLYLCWGSISESPEGAPRFLDIIKLLPTTWHVRTLRSETGRRNLSRFIAERTASSTSSISIETSNNSNSLTSLIPEQLPPVDKFSGQRSGEHWKDFFARREKRNLAVMGRETLQEKESRLKREEHAAKRQVPGRKGARVFVWIDVDGFRVRRAAGRQNYEHYWDVYHAGQRRYDPFCNEWDLCTEFDPDEDRLSCMDDDSSSMAASDTFDSSDVGLPLPEELFPKDLDSDHREGEYSTLSDLQREYPPSEADGAHEGIQILIEDLEDTAYFRYGFSFQSPSSSPASTPPWSVVREYLGDGRWRANKPDPSSDIRTSLCCFFGYLQENQRIPAIPAQLHDLRQDNADVHHLPSRIAISVMKSANARTYYMIHLKSSSSDATFVFLKSAAVVLEVICHRWNTLEEIMLGLLDRSIPFNACTRGPAPVSKRQLSLVPLSCPGLGYRPKDHKPAAFEYRCYEDVRDQLLRSPRGRAALLAGGLISRIAREVVSFDDVFDGPSSTVFNEGVVISEGDEKPGYWDDQLTEDEINIICGVYKVDTGQRHGSGRQTSDSSWWPKPSIWENCGLWANFWSADCEKWFLSRLEECRQGKANLRTPSNWRHSLRFSKTVNRVVQNNDACAAEWLDSLHLPQC